MKQYEISDNYCSWFRLDNSAAIYPMLITLKTQSLFRVGVELKSYIDKEDLEKALKTTLKRYPSFEVELVQGFFRHYFIANRRSPVVEADDGSLLKKIDFRHNKGYLLRITYYKRKIFADIFHGLCDGTSAAEFLKTLVYYYLLERGENIPDEGKIKLVTKELPMKEFIDGFCENYKKFKLKDGTGKMTGKSAFSIRDKHFLKEGHGLIQGYLETDKLLLLSKSYGASLTVFISAVAMLSVAKIYCKGSANKDLVVFIPINLRRFYPSETIYNFTTFAKCRINPDTTPLNLESYIVIIKEQLANQLKKEELDIKLSFTSLMDKKPILKYMPLFLKSFITKIGSKIGGAARQTMIISNVGEITMPEKCKEHIESFNFNLNCNRRTPNNMAIVSYNNETVISFTRHIVATKIEKEFFTTLSTLGQNIKIVSNLREVR